MRAVRCPVLIGRAPELAALRPGLEGACNRQGVAVAILGAPGIGKTRLLRELGAEGRSAGMRVLVGRAVEAGTGTAFRPLAEALLAGLRDGPTSLDEASELAPFRPALGRLVPAWRVPGVVDESPVVLAEGLLRVLRLLGNEHGLVLALDDLQWADPESLAVVEYLADNLATEPVFMLWAARDTPGPAAELARAVAARGGMLLELGPLDDAEVTAMSAACLGREPSAELLAVLHRRAAGTPLLVEELLATGGADAATLIPATVHELVVRRIASLSELARDCVRYSAVLGWASDWSLLPPLLEAEHEALLGAFREATTAQLLETTAVGFRFPHVLLRDAVLAAMLPPERARAAARALAAVRAAHPELDEPWDEIAASLASLAGDAGTAAQILHATGRRSLSRGALATAEATLRQAADLAGQDKRLSADIDEALAETLCLAGKTDAATAISARLIQRLDPHRDGSLLAEAHLRLARVHGAAGDWRAAEAELDQASWCAEHAGDIPVSARVSAVAAHAGLVRSRFEEARARAEAALAVAEQIGDTDTACDALEMLGRIARRADLGEAEALFERARALADQAGLAVREVRALHELSTLDAMDSLRFDRLEAARHRALRVGALGTVAVVDLHLAATAIMRWDVDRAAPLAWRSVEGARQLRLATLPKALVLAAVAEAVRGHAESGEPALNEALRLAPDDPHLPGEVWGARAHRSLLASDHSRALVELELTVANGLGEVIASPHVGLWLLMSASATGTLESLPAGIMASRWNRAYLRFAEAVVLGRAGRASEAAAAFAEADTEMWEPVDVRWHRRHARRVVAEAALADGWGDPVRWLTEDLPFFETLGHDRIASACRGLLRRAGAPVPRRSRYIANIPEELRRLGVTAREHEVLQLVADGLDNRGVATRLVLSPRTVEKHVERLLAKTGCVKRIELVAFAGRMRTSPAGR
jgi:DNA-binding CsgD family transcriptional regulator/tetratricopeptide (TPR) repeat protein